MIRVKCFVLVPLKEGDIQGEFSLQKWLKDNPKISVQHILQSGDIKGFHLLTILYTEEPAA